jgi:hypothetical protein
MSDRTLSYYGAVRSKKDDVDDLSRSTIFGFSSREERDKWLTQPASDDAEKLSVNYRKAKAVLKVKKHQCITIDFTTNSCHVIRNSKYANDPEPKARKKKADVQATVDPGVGASS